MFLRSEITFQNNYMSEMAICSEGALYRLPGQLIALYMLPGRLIALYMLPGRLITLYMLPGRLIALYMLPGRLIDGGKTNSFDVN